MPTPKPNVNEAASLLPNKASDSSTFANPFIGLKEFYNYIKSSVSRIPTVYFYFSVNFYANTIPSPKAGRSFGDLGATSDEFWTSENLNMLHELRYCIQSVSTPQLKLQAYTKGTGGSGSNGPVNISNIFGGSVILANSYVLPSTNNMQIQILNTERPLSEAFIYDWIHECVRNEYSSMPIPKVNMAIKYWSPSQMQSNMDGVPPRFIYYFTGLFPTNIDTWNPKQSSSESDKMRKVDFSFNDFVIIDSQTTAMKFNLLELWDVGMTSEDEEAERQRELEEMAEMARNEAEDAGALDSIYQADRGLILDDPYTPPEKSNEEPPLIFLPQDIARMEEEARQREMEEMRMMAEQDHLNDYDPDEMQDMSQYTENDDRLIGEEDHYEQRDSDDQNDDDESMQNSDQDYDEQMRQQDMTGEGTAREMFEQPGYDEADQNDEDSIPREDYDEQMRQQDMTGEGTAREMFEQTGYEEADQNEDFIPRDDYDKTDDEEDFMRRSADPIESEVDNYENVIHEDDPTEAAAQDYLQADDNAEDDFANRKLVANSASDWDDTSDNENGDLAFVDATKLTADEAVQNQGIMRDVAKGTIIEKPEAPVLLPQDIDTPEGQAALEAYQQEREAYKNALKEVGDTDSLREAIIEDLPQPPVILPGEEDTPEALATEQKYDEALAKFRQDMDEVDAIEREQEDFGMHVNNEIIYHNEEETTAKINEAVAKAEAKEEAAKVEQPSLPSRQMLAEAENKPNLMSASEKMGIIASNALKTTTANVVSESANLATALLLNAIKPKSSRQSTKDILKSSAINLATNTAVDAVNGVVNAATFLARDVEVARESQPVQQTQAMQPEHDLINRDEATIEQQPQNKPNEQKNSLTTTKEVSQTQKSTAETTYDRQSSETAETSSNQNSGKQTDLSAIIERERKLKEAEANRDDGSSAHSAKVLASLDRAKEKAGGESAQAQRMRAKIEKEHQRRLENEKKAAAEQRNLTNSHINGVFANPDSDSDF